jgi:hypothetical protein
MKHLLRSPQAKLVLGLWLLWQVDGRTGYAYDAPEVLLDGAQVIYLVCLEHYSRPYLRAVGPPGLWFQLVPKPAPAPEPIRVIAEPKTAAGLTAGPPPPPANAAPAPKPAATPPPEVPRPRILPDEMRKRVKPEDFIPFFQAPDPAPTSTATYHQS